jgi:hypothetical protein
MDTDTDMDKSTDTIVHMHRHTFEMKLLTSIRFWVSPIAEQTKMSSLCLARCHFYNPKIFHPTSD